MRSPCCRTRAPPCCTCASTRLPRRFASTWPRTPAPHYARTSACLRACVPACLHSVCAHGTGPRGPSRPSCRVPMQPHSFACCRSIASCMFAPPRYMVSFLTNTVVQLVSDNMCRAGPPNKNHPFPRAEPQQIRVGAGGGIPQRCACPWLRVLRLPSLDSDSPPSRQVGGAKSPSSRSTHARDRCSTLFEQTLAGCSQQSRLLSSPRAGTPGSPAGRTCCSRAA